jgi:hypothetical protein
MGKVILEPSIRKQLGKFSQGVELIDDQGQQVGFFLPPKVFQKMLAELAQHDMSPEQLEEARAELRNRGGYTTAEALAYLQKFQAREMA